MVEQIINLVAEIAERQEALKKLFDGGDIDFCFAPVRPEENRYMGTTQIVHVFKGIKKLAEMFGAELVHPKSWADGKEEEHKLAFVQGHFLYFQLADGEEELTWR